jgi:hypothetical protein
MDEAQFWALIEAGGRKASADPDRQLAVVHRELLKLSPAEMRDFHRQFNRKLADAYTWDLWGAAYLVNGGCSDDGFYYFCAWLISRGRVVYDAAVQNPDTLAGLTDPERDDYEFEDLWYVPQHAHEDLRGEELPPVAFRWPKRPRGRHWDFDDDKQVSRRLPKLAKVYGVEPDAAADQ